MKKNVIKRVIKRNFKFLNAKDFYPVYFFSKFGVIKNHYSCIVLCKHHKLASTPKSSFQQETLFRHGHCFCSQIFISYTKYTK